MQFWSVLGQDSKSALGVDKAGAIEVGVVVGPSAVRQSHGGCEVIDKKGEKHQQGAFLGGVIRMEVYQCCLPMAPARVPHPGHAQG